MKARKYQFVIVGRLWMQCSTGNDGEDGVVIVAEYIEVKPGKGI